MNVISKEEGLKQKDFIARVFLECFNIFKKEDIKGKDYLTEFKTILINEHIQNLLLNTTSSVLMQGLIFDEDRRNELSKSYFNNSPPSPTILSKHEDNSLINDYVIHYLMTNFFKSEGLEPFENYSLGFRLILKDGNEILYFKYYNFVLSELQKITFTNDLAETLKLEYASYKPFQRHAQLLQPIKNMDFELFINSYPDVKIYPKNSNKIFAKKLNDIFEVLKNEGNTVLNIKDCTSTCDCEDCKKHPDKYIYAFVGNVSANYFALTMHIDRDYQPLLISISRISEFSIDRENNNKTKYNETIIGQNFGTQYSFTILDDELDNFTPTDSYLDLINIKNKAFEELELKNNTINTYDELKDWLTKYNIDNLTSKVNYKILEEFNLLYNELKSFYNDCIHINETKNAMRDFFSEDKNSKMTQWLMKYENFYNDNLGDLSLKLFAVEDEYLVFSLIKQYKISLSVFEDVFPFIKVFENNYFNEIEKLKCKYLNQQNITLDEYENNRFFIKNELTHFYNLSIQTSLNF